MRPKLLWVVVVEPQIHTTKTITVHLFVAPAEKIEQGLARLAPFVANYQMRYH